MAAVGENYFDLSGVTADITGDFLAAGGVTDMTGLPELDLTGERIGSPIARPGAVLCGRRPQTLHAV